IHASTRDAADEANVAAAITLREAGSIVLGDVSTGGTLDVVAGGSITQSAALNVGGAASFTTNADQSITLTRDNAFGGAVSFAVAGGGSLQNVSITDLSALALQMPAVTGNLTVVARGPITQSSGLTVGGVASFLTLDDTGAAITLAGTNNF